MKVKEAIKLLKENGFILSHRKGSHLKFSKEEMRVIITDKGRNHTGNLHPKQIKEVNDAINGKLNNKHLEKII